jgi:PD-(D/E)XK endonuclease
MRSIRRGNIGEAALLNALIRRGLDVLVPFGEGHPYDLVLHLDGAFLRIQCKLAWLAKGGCVCFNAHTTDHGKGQRSYNGRADVFGVFLPARETVYIVPVGATASDGRLRLEPTRNNQVRGVRFAVQYEIDRWSPESLRAAALASAAA